MKKRNLALEARERLTIKQQLRDQGIKVPEAIMFDLAALQVFAKKNLKRTGFKNRRAK